jgi:glutathione S-transferase
VIDFGNRYFALTTHEAFAGLKAEYGGRAQGVLTALAERTARLPGSTIARSGWSAADMWLFAAVTWFEGMPERVGTFPIAKQILSLGWKLPDNLSRWADQHRDRADVRALS